MRAQRWLAAAARNWLSEAHPLQREGYPHLPLDRASEGSWYMPRALVTRRHPHQLQSAACGSSSWWCAGPASSTSRSCVPAPQEKCSRQPDRAGTVAIISGSLCTVDSSASAIPGMCRWVADQQHTAQRCQATQCVSLLGQQKHMQTIDAPGFIFLIDSRSPPAAKSRRASDCLLNTSCPPQQIRRGDFCTTRLHTKTNIITIMTHS